MRTEPEPVTSPPSAGAVRREVERILASRVFAASDRMSRFLRFAVEKALDGRGGELKEYAVAVEVFGKPADFDARIDPIVRVEARRLRSKLKAYYEEEGRDDEVLIEFPVGGYVPRFRARTSAAAATHIENAPAENIAVLPFSSLSAEAEKDYFSDGLAEELIHALTKAPGLRVVAWHSSAKLRGQEADIRGIARLLHVGSVVMGSVRRSGKRLRIAVGLIATETGQYLWSEAYDRQLEDVFAIQEEIACAIADALRVQLVGRATTAATANTDAYTAYLRGRFHWNKRTPAGLELALEQFKEAVNLDPAFAAAHAGVADAYMLLADHGFAQPEAVVPMARAAALRAVELAPNLADAYASLGLIEAVYEWRWGEAERHFRRAIALNPGYVTARHWYACDCLAPIGQVNVAIDMMQTAIDLDPLSHVLRESRAYLLLLARRYDECIEACAEIAELDPHFYKAYSNMARAHVHKGMFAEGVALFEKARQLIGDIPPLIGALGQAQGLAGNRDEAARLLAKLIDMSKQRHVPASAFAMIHIGLGDYDSALDVLEEGVARRQPSLAALNVHPGYDALRGNPRFERLLERIGFRSGVR